MVSIGELIKEVLRERELSAKWFAEELSCSRTNVYKIFAKKSIDTNDLMRICRILDYDFFEAYSKELKKKTHNKK